MKELPSTIASFLAILSLVASNEINRCANVSVSDEQVSKWLNFHATTKYWERPKKDSNKPINVYVKMGITSFANIVIKQIEIDIE